MSHVGYRDADVGIFSYLLTKSRNDECAGPLSLNMHSRCLHRTSNVRCFTLLAALLLRNSYLRLFQQQGNALPLLFTRLRRLYELLLNPLLPCHVHFPTAAWSGSKPVGWGAILANFCWKLLRPLAWLPAVDHAHLHVGCESPLGCVLWKTSIKWNARSTGSALDVFSAATALVTCSCTSVSHSARAFASCLVTYVQ
jgi:hypothetical protein